MTEHMAHGEAREEGVVGIVLSGAGARGAYEAGVLSVLLPLLEGADRPRIIVGTSAGALNAAMLASAIDRGANPAKALTTDGWEQITPKKVFTAPLLSMLRLVERWLRRPVGVSPGLLDTGVLRATLRRMLPNPRFASGVERGVLDAVAIVASSCSSAGAVAFFESRLNPQSNADVEYVKTELGLDHLMASSAFPLAFPARWVEGSGQGWYIDGGVHLNTPIKPAIDLGASRILVIGATPWDISQPPEWTNPPNMIDDIGQLLQAMLVGKIQEDLRALVRVNRQVRARGPVSGPSASKSSHRVVGFCVVKPSNDSLSEIAARTWPSGVLPFIRSLGCYSALGPLTAQRQRPGEFLSYLCFSQDFISKAIACGRSDAQRLVGVSNKIPWRFL